MSNAPHHSNTSCVSREVRRSLLDAFGEHDVGGGGNDDDGDHSDTDLCCSIITELYKSVLLLTGSQVQFRIAARRMTPFVACLTLYDVPVLSSDACVNIRRVGSGDEIIDIKAEFEDDENRMHPTGCVKIQFWRSKVPHDDRKPNLHTRLVTRRPLTATPDWAELNIDAREFDADRSRITSIIESFYNMREMMPVGIKTRIELIYKKNHFADDNADIDRGNGRAANSRKRAADDDHYQSSSPTKRSRKSVKYASASSNGSNEHVGYCIYFSNSSTPLPDIDFSFAELYLRDLIGPALKSWLVVSQSFRNRQHTAPSGKQGRSSTVERRAEEFCVILRRWSETTETTSFHTIGGAPYLVSLLKSCAAEQIKHQSNVYSTAATMSTTTTAVSATTD